MTDADYQAFGDEFRRLASALLRFQPKGEELTHKIDAYFHTLKRFSLSDVIAKADRWLETEKEFPVPSEWAGVIAHKAAPLSALTPAEHQAYRAAELARWEGPPCRCGSCLGAGVDDKPLRFVPDVLRDGRDDRALDPTGKVVTRGHWAHGHELARWYRARADWYNTVLSLGLRPDVLTPKPARGRGKSDLALVTEAS